MASSDWLFMGRGVGTEFVRLIRKAFRKALFCLEDNNVKITIHRHFA